jgi:hypothetical protein
MDRAYPMNKAYYLVWNPDPQYWACILYGEKSYAHRDSEIQFLEQTRISELPVNSFLRNLLDRDVQRIKINNFLLQEEFGFSLSEMEYERLKKLMELHQSVLTYESLSKY